MSYCRFIEGDVYMFETCDSTIHCCCCSLAELVTTIFTKGADEDSPIFKDIKPCEDCEGEGCEICMMNGDSVFHDRESALKHLQEHIEKGDNVPPRAMERLKEEIEEELPL